jgi:hypothetical protein
MIHSSSVALYKLSAGILQVKNFIQLPHLIKFCAFDPATYQTADQ